jgi:hypothetical protein
MWYRWYRNLHLEYQMIEKSWYKVYKCNSTDCFDYDSDKELFASDNLALAHSYAYNAWLASGKTEVYTIIQPYEGSCRGGYGFPEEQNG